MVQFKQKHKEKKKPHIPTKSTTISYWLKMQPIENARMGLGI